jgi:hypothetical protein
MIQVISNEYAELYGQPEEKVFSNDAIHKEFYNPFFKFIKVDSNFEKIILFSFIMLSMNQKDICFYHYS